MKFKIQKVYKSLNEIIELIYEVNVEVAFDIKLELVK